MGFYCTESLELAKEWSVELDRNGYANIYQIDDSKLSILDLTSDEYCILHWLAVLLENREFDIPSPLAFEAKEYILNNFAVDYKKYDAITG